MQKHQKNVKISTTHTGATTLRNCTSGRSSQQICNVCVVLLCAALQCLALHSKLVGVSWISVTHLMGTLFPDFTLLHFTAHIPARSCWPHYTYRKCSTHCAILTELLCHRDDEKHRLSTYFHSLRFCQLCWHNQRPAEFYYRHCLLSHQVPRLDGDRRQVSIAGQITKSTFSTGEERQARIRWEIKGGTRAMLILPRQYWLPHSLYFFWLHRHVAMELIHATATWPPANKTSALATAFP